MKNNTNLFRDFKYQNAFLLVVPAALFLIDILSFQGFFAFFLFQSLNTLMKAQIFKIKIAAYCIASFFLINIVDEINYFEIYTIASLFLIELIYTDPEKIKFVRISSTKIDLFSPKYSLSFLLLFLITLLTQNAYINFESIDWDISSYLVASNNISLENFPYQSQWESKQPILYILYKMLISFTADSLVLFKLINDIPIFLIALLLFRLVNLEIKNNLFSLMASSLYLIFMSTPWGTAEYSEIYSLLFIAAGLNLLSTKNMSNISYFLGGLMFGIAIMINIGSVVVISGSVFFLRIKKRFKYKILYFFLGFISPLIVLSILYFQKGLMTIFIETTFLIPLNYPSSASFSIGILINFFRSYFEYSKLLYLTFITTFFVFFKQIRLVQYKLVSLTASSLLFVVLALHGYYHHYIFFVFFFSYMTVVPLSFEGKNFYAAFLLITIFSVLGYVVPKSVNNLYNINEIQQTYPIYNLQLELNDITKRSYTVLALDYHLINFYLKQDNFSYVVHPTNLEEEFITKKLIEMDKIQDKEISYLIQYKSPDVVICSEDMLDFNCEVSDYDKRYIQLYFDEINSMENVNYYKDPYKKIRVYVLKEILK